MLRVALIYSAAAAVVALLLGLLCFWLWGFFWAGVVWSVFAIVSQAIVCAGLFLVTMTASMSWRLS